MPNRNLRNAIRVTLCAAAAAVAQQQGDLGYRDTPIIPNQKWHVHDPDRPHPRVVTASAPGAPSSDATILFDGKDLKQWFQRGRGADRAKQVDAQWKVENGYFEVTPGTGDLITRDKFGDVQLHIEWASPAEVRGSSQNRGNSGIYMMSRYEFQVLDSWQNPTYADGQAGAIYGQWPPMVNPVHKPGEWNTYDMVFEAPRWEGEKLVKQATITLFFNGLIVHNHKELTGTTEHRVLGTYKPHGEDSILLQDHGHRVRYRNIWIRRLSGYDQPEH